MREFGTSAIEAIRNACLQPDIDKHKDPAQHFLLTSHAKHRIPSSFPLNNLTQSSSSLKESKGHGKDRGKSSVKRNTVPGKGIIQPKAKEDQLYIEQSCFIHLTDAHKHLLKKRKHWNAV